jgi:succinyl-CoA synthetase beta subunit
VAQLTEHLSKMLLARYGVPVPTTSLVSDAAAASAVAAQLGFDVAVKAQLPLGGRGKSGAILRASDPESAAQAFTVVTSVRVDGLKAETALVEPWSKSDREVFLAITMDGAAGGPVALFSAEGGVEVESAQRLRKLSLREDGTFPVADFRRLAANDGLPPQFLNETVAIFQALARAFHALDARLIEINPLVWSDGHALAIDARVIVDDNALFRQPEVRALLALMRPRHIEDLVRDRSRLEYVHLAGHLGLISSGAGMTMAVMDLIGELGATAACFLDCSANPTASGYGAALDLLLEDPAVDAILVSVFGGLTRVDSVARTLVGLLVDKAPNKPITIRLMGTNADKVDGILAAHGLRNHPVLEEAVATAIDSMSAAGVPA